MLSPANALLEPQLQYGAFGLCILLVGVVLWLVVRGEKERGDLGARLDNRARAYEQLVARLTSIADNALAAINRLSDALEVRPCLKGDRAFRIQRPTLDTEGEDDAQD